MWRILRDEGNANFRTPSKSRQELILQRIILISIEDYSDSDALSESEYELDQGSTPGSDCDTDFDADLEPGLSETIRDKYEHTPWNLDAQLQAQFNTRLAQLHPDIKTQAQLPDPTYEKLPRSWCRMGEELGLGIMIELLFQCSG
jgi:hypothetical protein